MEFSKLINSFPKGMFAALDEKKLELQAKGKKVYNLSIGTPDFETPEYLKEALIEAARDSENWKYAMRDLPELKEAVCDYYQDRFGVTLQPDMVCSCYGTQEGMSHLGMVLCNAGDTVLLPTPCYPVFMAGAFMAGAVPYYYPMTAENKYLPAVEDIPEEIAIKAKYMVVSLPSNPTGSVADDEIYEKVIAFARKYDILIIHDNAYSDIIFDGITGGSFLSHEGAMDVGVEFFSLSKSFNLTGARISFLVGRPDVVAMFNKLHTQIDFGMFLPVQKTAIAALRGNSDRIKEQCQKYQERRDALCQGLRKIGWQVNDSKGSMFLWAPIPASYTSSLDFCMDLLEATGVLCAPGSGFGPMGEGYVRFALVLPPEGLKEVAEAIEPWWRSL